MLNDDGIDDTLTTNPPESAETTASPSAETDSTQDDILSHFQEVTGSS